jgi:hypothetical protein
MNWWAWMNIHNNHLHSLPCLPLKGRHPKPTPSHIILYWLLSSQANIESKEKVCNHLLFILILPISQKKSSNLLSFSKFTKSLINYKYFKARTPYSAIIECAKPHECCKPCIWLNGHVWTVVFWKFSNFDLGNDF